MIKFKQKNISIEPVVEDIPVKKTRIKEIDSVNNKQVIQEHSTEKFIKHIKDTESLLEFMLTKMQKLDEELTTLRDRPAITLEDISSKALNRKIIINKDAKGKIIGADVIDSILEDSPASTRKTKVSDTSVKRKIILKRDSAGKIVSADIIDSVK